MTEKIGIVIIRRGRYDEEKSVQKDNNNNKNLNSALISIAGSQSCYNHELIEPINRGVIMLRKNLYETLLDWSEIRRFLISVWEMIGPGTVLALTWSSHRLSLVSGSLIGTLVS